jgi:hypothetical protein
VGACPMIADRSVAYGQSIARARGADAINLLAG